MNEVADLTKKDVKDSMGRVKRALETTILYYLFAATIIAGASITAVSFYFGRTPLSIFAYNLNLLIVIASFTIGLAMGMILMARSLLSKTQL